MNISLSAVVKCLEKALRPEVGSYAIIFVDHILVMSKTFEECLQNLKTKFWKFREANVSLNMDKCEFIETSIKFSYNMV